MKIKKFNVIGIMSGTSCDGLDIAYCSYWMDNGKWHYELINKSFTQYDPVMSEKLLKSSKLSSYDLKKLDIELGELISTNILSLIKNHSIKPFLISSHGHTVLHNPAEKITLQIGNPLIISNKTKIKVIDLCRPCKSLQKNLGQDNIIKEFLRKGGLRCEILTSANIKVGDKIKVVKID